MKKKQIMVICKNIGILQTIIRLINQNDIWNGVAADCFDTALLLAKDYHFDLILLGAGLDQEEEDQLTKVFGEESVCIKHYGGGSGLLYSEIQQAL
ncbi:MAG TPA: hypothetical protein VN040_13140 [Pseudosphingobacterium sp.]|nr:hypothetical protein [Pseudosphingobacterium sp.]